MNKRLAVLSSTLLCLSLCYCSNNNVDYTEKELNVYTKAEKKEEKITPTATSTYKVRFYNDYPNVPFTNPYDYFNAFFKTELKKEVVGNSTYKYINSLNDYIAFNAGEDLFITNGVRSYNSHPDATSETGKLFLKDLGSDKTTPLVKSIALSNYNIDVKSDGKDAYVPLTLLSKLAGGFMGYNIQYNGKDLYVIDGQAQLTPEVRKDAYYGPQYYEVLDDFTTTRPVDLAKYTYNELCFVFDNLRGYTSQLHMIDNNLLSLGLNGVLEQYRPKIKEYLLSTDKQNYYAGLFALFGGLNDGGHTAITTTSEGFKTGSSKASEIEGLKDWASSFVTMVLNKQMNTLTFDNYKAGLLGMKTPDFVNNSYYYLKDDASKTAYIGFDHFEVDYRGWDNYYNGKGEIPSSKDSYSFIRDKFYQAKKDGIKNLVIDLTSNGGGDSSALMGIVGLLNGAKADFAANDTLIRSRTTQKYAVDINLDGKFDDADAEELKQFDFNVGILTTSSSFSCGNLLPSLLKEMGYKIIGEKSGGGSCAIIMESTADGVCYGHSSYYCLSDATGNNIDSGVPVDFIRERLALPTGMFDPSEFFDFAAIGEYLSSAYQK